MNRELLALGREHYAWVIPADVGMHWMFVVVAEGKTIIFDSLLRQIGRTELLERTWNVLKVQPGGVLQKPTLVFAKEAPQQAEASFRPFRCNCVHFFRELLLFMVKSLDTSHGGDGEGDVVEEAREEE
jgi:hypothetical protein